MRHRRIRHVRLSSAHSKCDRNHRRRVADARHQDYLQRMSVLPAPGAKRQFVV